MLFRSIQSLTSSSLFGHSDEKGGENFEGELRKSLHNVRGSIGLVLETLIHRGCLLLVSIIAVLNFTAFV